MAKGNELVTPATLAKMRAELQALAKTEPGSKELLEVVKDLLPLIRGCRDRGHSWAKISASVKKYHSGLTPGRLRNYVFELDPSFESKGKSSPKKSLVPDSSRNKSVQGSLLDGLDNSAASAKPKRSRSRKTS